MSLRIFKPKAGQDFKLLLFRYRAKMSNCAKVLKVMMCERFLRLGSIWTRSLLNMTQLRLVDILLFHLLTLYLTLSYSRLINE